MCIPLWLNSARGTGVHVVIYQGAHREGCPAGSQRDDCAVRRSQYRTPDSNAFRDVKVACCLCTHMRVGERASRDSIFMDKDMGLLCFNSFAGSFGNC